MKPPTTQHSWSSVSDRANVPARRRSGISRWISASSESLPERLGEPGGETEQHGGGQPVEEGHHDRHRGVRQQHDDDRDLGADPAQHRAEGDADGAAEPGGADHQPEQQGGPVLPAGERLVAQQERHEHRQEPAQQPHPGVGAERDHHAVRDGRAPGVPCGPAGTGPRPPSCPPVRAAGSPGSSRRRTPGRRSAATTAARTSTPRRPAAPRSAAPATELSEIRELALTRLSRSGSTRGTAAARVTPYALDATRQPSAAGKSATVSPEPHGVREHPAQERPQRHRRADRPAPAVAEAVQERPDQRRDDRERQHRQAEEQRDLAAGLVGGHLEEQRAGQRDRHRGVAGPVERVQLDQPRQPALAGALGVGGAAGLAQRVARGATGGRPGPSHPASRRPRGAAAALGEGPAAALAGGPRARRRRCRRRGCSPRAACPHLARRHGPVTLDAPARQRARG